MALKARYDHLAARYEQAIKSCTSLLRFGDMIQKDAERVLAYHLGITVLELGLRRARDLARDKHMPQEALSKLSEALAHLGPFDRGLIRALKVEYTVAANSI